MAVALATIVKQLEDSGIVAPGKLENFVPPKAHPTSVEELVAELVKQHHLTKFQAAQVTGGRAKSLILGGYTILDKIGAGGMGQVFKAQHRRMDRVVAIKMLPPTMTKDPAAVARFEREVRAAAKLEHPNIVTTYDADQVNGVHFMVMQYVEGQDLSQLVKQNGPFPVAKATNYLLQAARGLEFAHGEGVVHRDIKPGNLLLDKKGTVKILDMGLARIESAAGVEAQAELTGTGAVMGTVDYMAPEQALSTKNADARADIYSLGCTLYYLLVGRPAYEGETITAKLVAHQAHAIPELRKACSEASPELEAIFQQMLAKRIAERYQSMSALIADLERLGTSSTTSSDAAPTVRPVNSEPSGFTVGPSIQIAPTVRKTANTVKIPAHDGMASAAGLGALRWNKKTAVIIGGWTLVCAGLIAGLVLSSRKPPEPEVVISVPIAKTATPPPPPLIDYALEFAGSGYATTPIFFDGKHPITVEAYVTPEITSGSIIGDGEGDRGISLHVNDSGWQFAIHYGGAVSTSIKPPLAMRSVHLAGVWDGAKAQLFVDGIPQPEVRSSTIFATGMPLLIGANPDNAVKEPPHFLGTQMRFRGIINEVRISKTARYRKHFEPEKRFTPDADTLALYHFDENRGMTARDASANGNHATIYGARWVRATALPGSKSATPAVPEPTASAPPTATQGS
ncbi:MAG: protein kinase [Planctomycetia bacterium]|nr:protein kinase [Planctomycetia bacterium]